MGQSITGDFGRRRRLELVAGGSRSLTDAQRDILRNDAARVRFSRQLRRKLFGAAMFAETAWDILLTLYLADGREPRPGAYQLAASTGSPLSTTTRWLTYLEEEGLTSSAGRDAEGNAGSVELSRKGRSLLDDYFLELHEAESSWPPDEDPENPSGG